MTVKPGRLWLTRTLAISAIIACLGGLAAWRNWPWRQKYEVPLPRPDASAAQVVTAYLHALDAHDQATADALTAPGARDMTALWLHNTTSITGIKIDSVRPGAPYSVCTDFQYTSHWWTQDVSFPNGEHFWCYDMVRGNGRWLIANDGLG
jgi:hypothetical protein